jgi:hypothetical protein
VISVEIDDDASGASLGIDRHYDIESEDTIPRFADRKLSTE